MAAALSEILAPQIVLGVFSLLRRGRGAMGSWLGFHPTKFDERSVQISGPNTMATGTTARQYVYRIFNETRVPMKVTAPGAPATTIAPNPYAQNTVSIARWHTMMPLLWEMLGNLSNAAGPNSMIDTNGQNYIAQQERFMAAQGNRTVEFMAAGMMRDSLYLSVNGSELLPAFTQPSGAYIQVNFQIPAGNKNQLNMLGTGNLISQPWSLTGTRIIGDLLQIQAAYAQLSAYEMTDVWINSIMWDNIITNTEVRNVGGSLNQPFATFEMERGPENSGPPSRRATLKALPGVTFHLCDDTTALGADLDPVNSATAGPSVATLNKLVPDNMAIFTTDPGTSMNGDGMDSWCKLVYSSEMISENPGVGPVLKTGWSSWHMYSANPSVIHLFSLLNAVPALFNPNVIAPGVVVF